MEAAEKMNAAAELHFYVVGLLFALEAPHRAVILESIDEYTSAIAAEAVAEERKRLIAIVQDRRDDMRSCNRDDLCDLKSSVLDTVLSDFTYMTEWHGPEASDG